jgi:hypothetical protein
MNAPKMSVFEELIRAQQPKRHGSVHQFPEMTLPQLVSAIIEIEQKETALQFKIDYIAFSKVFWQDRYDPYQVVNETIAACFDKMSAKQIKMWNELGVQTPVRRIPLMRY